MYAYEKKIMAQFDQSLQESFRRLADYAAQKNIRLILQQLILRMPDNIEGLFKLVKEVYRPNFTLASAVSLLLNDEVNLE